jgi:hypothetical protein
MESVGGREIYYALRVVVTIFMNSSLHHTGRSLLKLGVEHFLLKMLTGCDVNLVGLSNHLIAEQRRLVPVILVMGSNGWSDGWHR